MSTSLLPDTIIDPAIPRIKIVKKNWKGRNAAKKIRLFLFSLFFMIKNVTAAEIAATIPLKIARAIKWMIITNPIPIV